jgi:hypothetical protein
MSAVERESDQLSARVRVAAARAIEICNHPMTVHEIEAFFSANDPNLSAEVSSKCYDYLRVVLSLSRVPVFSKFTSHCSDGTTDRRSIYYGLTTVAYDPQTWSLIGFSNHGISQSHPPRRGRPPVIKFVQPRRVLRPPMGHAPMFRVAVRPEVTEAMTRLSAGIEQDHPLWKALMQAIEYLHEAMCCGVPPLAVLDAILISSPELRQPNTATDVQIILKKIASDKQDELMAVEVGSEPSVWQLR